MEQIKSSHVEQRKVLREKVWKGLRLSYFSESHLGLYQFPESRKDHHQTLNNLDIWINYDMSLLCIYICELVQNMYI